MKVKLPVEHSLYDFCWSKLLPLSLCFLLIDPGKSVAIDDQAVDEEENYWESVGDLGVPFLFGSMSSILGSLVAFFISISLSQSQYPLKNLASISINDAILSAGCITSSYIGGAFAVATSKIFKVHA